MAYILFSSKLMIPIIEDKFNFLCVIEFFLTIFLKLQVYLMLNNFLFRRSDLISESCCFLDIKESTFVLPLTKVNLSLIFNTGAVPKKILDLMNVEKLTRENVASHLQVKPFFFPASVQYNLNLFLLGTLIVVSHHFRNTGFT